MNDFTSQLSTAVDGLLQWGTSEINDEDPGNQLESQLIDLYYLYFMAKNLKQSSEVITSPDFDLPLIRKTVKKNLPSMGEYPIAQVMRNNLEEIEWTITDTREDLTHIIYELLILKWHLKNTGEKEALWHFVFSFENHIKTHLAGLIFYLSRKGVAA